MENTQFPPNWQHDLVLKAILDFWMANVETIHHWQNRLKDAGHDTLLISRIADSNSLRQEFGLVFQLPSC